MKIPVWLPVCKGNIIFGKKKEKDGNQVEKEITLLITGRKTFGTGVKKRAAMKCDLRFYPCNELKITKESIIMRRILPIPVLFSAFFWLLRLSDARAQCENLVLDFSGNGDYISLNTAATPVSGDADFTVEAWFNISLPFSTCSSNHFRRLFDFVSTSGTFTQLDVGECNGNLAILWTSNTSGGNAPYTLPLGTGCHHIAVVRKGNSLDVYLDGTIYYTTTGIGTLNTGLFRVSIPAGGANPGWQGQVDDVRLWSTKRTQSEINDFKDCTLKGTPTGLVADWTFDQVSNVAVDQSANNNNGTLNNLSNSNFICNPCQPRFLLDITNAPSQVPVSLVAICSGDPAHFCISDNFGPVGPISGASVNWEYSDDGGLTWPAVTDPLFNGYCFGLPKGVLLNANCATSTTGYVDRIYRAKIVKTMSNPNYTCTFATSESNLKICCPVTGNITLTPVPAFVPPATTLCEGTVTVNVALSGPPFLAGLPIQWCVDGVPDPAFDNMTSFTYTGPAKAPGLCFEAKIQNCACPLATIKACIPVDAMPTGNIIIDQLFSTVVPNPLGGPYDYLICPGKQETLGYVGTCQNSQPLVWQFSFDPVNGPWNDLGTGNFWQITNTLPFTNPPNPLSPAIWPLNANCIYYRIECRPLSYPHSGCPPWHSNQLSICLQPNNLLTPVIQANPMQICDLQTSIITNQTSPNPTEISEQWYCNGLSFGGPMTTGSSIPATQTACYEVAVTDGCYTKFSNRECVILCDPVSIIKCPEDNPCACLDFPITLDGSMSYSNCGPIVNYEWTIVDINGTHTQTGPSPTLVYTFPLPISSATFTLTVTDSNGCMQVSKSVTIKPCE